MSGLGNHHLDCKQNLPQISAAGQSNVGCKKHNAVKARKTVNQSCKQAV